MKHAIHCETEEEARAVLEIGDEEGFAWADGFSLLSESQHLKEVLHRGDYEVCINLEREGGAAFDRLDFYQRRGYTIVKAKDFIEADRRRKVREGIKQFVHERVIKSLTKEP